MKTSEFGRGVEAHRLDELREAALCVAREQEGIARSSAGLWVERRVTRCLLASGGQELAGSSYVDLQPL